MDAGPRIDAYEWRGGREAMLRWGPEDGPVVVLALPLFEEANRTRGLLAAVARRLAACSIGCCLPDFPGQGESETTLAGRRLAHWQDALAAAADKNASHVVALRGGALTAGAAATVRKMHVSPIAGKELVRDLLRVRRAGALAAGTRPAGNDLDAPGPPLLLAGNRIDRPLLHDLMAAEPGRADRVVTLFPDATPADRSLAPIAAANADGDLPRFSKPWRLPEPTTDLTLADQMAAEIADWISNCGN